MASISPNFQELKFSSISDTNPLCEICWEDGAPGRSLFDIHPSRLLEEAGHHLACRTCIVRCLTTEDLMIEKVFTCHMCRKEVVVDRAAADSLGIPGHKIPLKIFYYTTRPQSITRSLCALEEHLRRMAGKAIPLPKLSNITACLLQDHSSFR
jgi:hypothetical protein